MNNWRTGATAMITATDLIALLPVIVLAAAAVAVMFAIAVRRNHRLAFVLTVAGILIALITVAPASDLILRVITPLVLVDRYSLAFIVLACAAGLVTAAVLGVFSRPRGHPEEIYLQILTALLGASVWRLPVTSRRFSGAGDPQRISVRPHRSSSRQSQSFEAGVKYSGGPASPRHSCCSAWPWYSRDGHHGVCGLGRKTGPSRLRSEPC